MGGQRLEWGGRPWSDVSRGTLIADFETNHVKVSWLHSIRGA